MTDSHRQQPSRTYTIDPGRDTLIALAQLPAWYEERTGRKLHRTVPYDWRQRGIRRPDGTRVCLPTIRFGGVRYTSAEAIVWWTASVDGAASGEGATS